MTDNDINMLSVIDSSISIGNRDDLWEYTKKQIKDGYTKPKRLSGRLNDLSKYNIPFGEFNLGHNTIFIKKDDEQKKEDDNIKIVDGKLVFPEDGEGDKGLELNISVKNDIPYQVYRKILYFGRLTLDELYHMYRGISREMFQIIINDMLNKRLLKIVKEKDEDVVFNDDAKTIEEFTKIVETDIQTLEITSIDEQRKTLEDKNV